MTPASTDTVPRFWPLFLIALGVHFLVVVIGAALGTMRQDMRPTDEPGTEELRDQILAGSAHAIEPWYRWDAGWYVNVATNGYANAGNSSGRLGVAFLPALPICLAVANSLGINIFWAGILIPNVAAAAGAAFFARLAASLTADRGTGLRAFVLLLAFPSSFFLCAPYNEAFGLLFTTLALVAWLQQHPLRAGVFAALGSLARMTGVALGVASLCAWLLEDRTRSGLKRAAILAFGSFFGLALFCGYLYWLVGDPFAGLKAHTSWGRKEPSIWNPWRSIQSIYDPERPYWGEALAALVFAILGIRAWIKRGAFWGIVTLVPIAQMMMSGTFLSGHRLVLAALPAFVEMAELLRNRLLFQVVVVVFAFIQFFLLNRFIHWQLSGAI
jgi:hypothetical protein